MKTEFAMFDSVTVPAIPLEAVAVAGYVGGRWPTFSTLKRTHPRAERLSIAINAREDAECLDVEQGDATISQAPAWVKWQRRKHPIRVRFRPPAVYCSVSSADALLANLAMAGIKRSKVRLWTAHYTGHAHRCSPACGYRLSTKADATQWTDSSRGRNLDESLCAPDFLRVPAVKRVVRKIDPRRWRRWGRI